MYALDRRGTDFFSVGEGMANRTRLGEPGGCTSVNTHAFQRLKGLTYRDNCWRTLEGDI